VSWDSWSQLILAFWQAACTNVCESAEKGGRQVRYRADGARIVQRLDTLRDYLIRCCPPD
jgi:hypothetical protein